MSFTQKILYSITSQSLTFDTKEGRPSSATFKVYGAGSDDSATVEFQGSCSVDSVNTTTSGAAGFAQSNRKAILLTSTASVNIGQEYLLTNAAGETEWVEPVAFTSYAVTSRYPLLNDYASGATFVGVRLSAAVTDSWAADDGNLSDDGSGNPGYRVLWSYTAGGLVRNAYTFADLIRVPGGHDITLNDLEPYFPQLRQTLGRDFRGAAEKYLTNAYSNFKLDLKSIGVDEDGVLDRFVVNELVRRRALYDLAMAGYHPSQVSYGEWLDTWKAEYQVTLDQHFRVTKKTVTATDPGNAASNSPGGLNLIR